VRLRWAFVSGCFVRPVRLYRSSARVSLGHVPLLAGDSARLPRLSRPRRRVGMLVAVRPPPRPPLALHPRRRRRRSPRRARQPRAPPADLQSSRRRARPTGRARRSYRAARRVSQRQASPRAPAAHLNRPAQAVQAPLAPTRSRRAGRRALHPVRRRRCRPRPTAAHGAQRGARAHRSCRPRATRHPRPRMPAPSSAGARRCWDLGWWGSSEALPLPRPAGVALWLGGRSPAREPESTAGFVGFFTVPVGVGRGRRG